MDKNKSTFTFLYFWHSNNNKHTSADALGMYSR